MRYDGQWRAALVFGLMALSQPAVSLADDEAVFRAVEAVLAEYRIYATCTALFPGSLELVEELWKREVSSGADALKNAGKNKLLLIRYQALAGGSKLYDPQMPLGEAVSLCERNKEALNRYHTLDVMRMADEMEKVMAGRANEAGSKAALGQEAGR